jgi:hypothetical protein
MLTIQWSRGLRAVTSEAEWTSGSHVTRPAQGYLGIVCARL